LFALFHDSRRFNEFHDPDHGSRGGELAREMCGTAFQLEPDRLATLADACTRHDKGQTAGDTTTGVCWDADRSSTGDDTTGKAFSPLTPTSDRRTVNSSGGQAPFAGYARYRCCESRFARRTAA
jgi:hypothetical protein